MAVIPEFSRDNFHLEQLDRHQQCDPTFTASEGAQQPLDLELCDPLAQPPHDHVLTGALSDPHRSLVPRRLRQQRPRLDEPRPWARWCGHCHRHQPLRCPRRRLD